MTAIQTVSVAVTQYASTVLALFGNDMNPAKASTPTLELQNKLGGKAGSWLAKGQQAVKSLDKRKIEGFVVTPAVRWTIPGLLCSLLDQRVDYNQACVKLTDMGAAQICLEDLMESMEAEETARIVTAHKPRAIGGERPRHIFSITLMRGENLLGKGFSKPADAFVVITDGETSERLLKSRTILGVEDPRW